MPRNLEGSFVGEMPENYPGGIEAWTAREDLVDPWATAIPASLVNEPADRWSATAIPADQIEEGPAERWPIIEIEADEQHADWWSTAIPAHLIDEEPAERWPIVSEELASPPQGHKPIAGENTMNFAAGAAIIRRVGLGKGRDAEGQTFEPALYWDQDISASLEGVQKTLLAHGFDVGKWNEKTFAFVESTIEKLYDQAGRRGEFKGVSPYTAGQMPPSEQGKLPIENAVLMACGYVRDQSMNWSHDEMQGLMNLSIDVEPTLVIGPNYFGPREVFENVPIPDSFPKAQRINHGNGNNLANELHLAATYDLEMKAELDAIGHGVRSIHINGVNPDNVARILASIQVIDQHRPDGLTNIQANEALNATRRFLHMYRDHAPTDIPPETLVEKAGARAIVSEKLSDELYQAASTDRDMSAHLRAISSSVSSISLNGSHPDDLRRILNGIRFIDQRRPDGLMDPNANKALNDARRFLAVHKDLVGTNIPPEILTAKSGATEIIPATAVATSSFMPTAKL